MKPMKPIERLMFAMDSCALARGEAQWINGYRAGKPEKEAELHPKEQERWQAVTEAEERFRQCCNRVLREARKPKKRLPPSARDSRDVE